MRVVRVIRVVRVVIVLQKLFYLVSAQILHMKVDFFGDSPNTLQ